MFLDSKIIKYTLILFLIIFSISINFYYGNIGAQPIDSFAFLDTGYSILKNKHPIKDYWIISGPFIDYVQAIFFKLFGVNWASYVFHASIFNLLIAASLFVTLVKHNLNFFFSFIYSTSVSILCYPVIGTPFSYQHSFILSLISIFVFSVAIKSKSSLLWFLLPIIMVLSFLSQQTPAGYINLLLIIFTIIYFAIEKNKNDIFLFFLGSLSICLYIFLHLLIIKIPFSSFVEQIFLFPLTIGESRIVGSEEAYVAANLFKKFTFRGVFGHFKFIHLFILSLIFVLILNLKNKETLLNLKKDILISILLIFSSFFYVFHQLITANQTFIFSLIPILAGFFHYQLKIYIPKKKYLNFFILIAVVLITFKYHNVYNVKRKFIDLQNVNLSKAVDGSLIDKKFKGLKWITLRHKDPIREINLIKDTLQKIKNDKRKKMVITHYQFFSFLLEEDLNIPNRWYFLGNNTFPLINHKHFEIYKKHFNKNLQKNNIEVIYIVESAQGEIKIEIFKSYLDDICFDSFYENEITSSHEINACKN